MITRETETTSTCIDHILVRGEECLLPTIVYKLNISDHYPVAAELHGLINKNERTGSFLDYAALNNCELLQNLIFRLGHELSKIRVEDVNIAMEQFTNTLVRVRDQYVPLKKYSSKRKIQKPPWINNNVRNAVAKRNKLYIQYKMAPTEEKLQRYKCQRNKVVNLIRTNKKIYYDSEFKAAKNTKYDFFAKTLGKANSATFPDIHDGLHNDFNHYFATVGEQLAMNIPQKNFSHQIPYNDNSMYLASCNEVEVNNILHSLKTKYSTGPDQISNVFLKLVAPAIIPKLTEIFNKAMQDSIFPKCLKDAKIVPLYKGGDKQVLGNYRPISLLNCLSKVFERILHKRIYSFFMSQRLFNDRQFGFRPKRSTVDAIADLLEDTRAKLDRGEEVAMSFLDFRKAFDTVNHEILFKKLEAYGIRGSVLQLIKSYMSERKQFVSFQNVVSDAREITCGVPQGSVLGPLLFIIYINDISEPLNKCSCTLFADDTTICSNSSEGKASTILENDLDRLKDWLNKNKLSLNIEKSNCVLFGRSKRQQSIQSVGGMKIAPKTKYLGLQIDSRLTFSDHINYVRSKLSRLCGMLKCLSKKLLSKYLVDFYLLYMKPVIQYGILLYGCVNKNALMPIYRLQKKPSGSFLKNSGMQILIVTSTETRSSQCSICTQKSSLNFQ